MSVQTMVSIVVSAVGLLGVIISILSFFVKTSDGRKFEISPRSMAAVIFSAMILSTGLALLQYTPLQEHEGDNLPDFDWDYECFDGANLCIMTHDGDSYSTNDVCLTIGRSESVASVICESAASTIWVEVHPLASYTISALFDFGEYSMSVASAYTQLLGTSSPNTVEIVHLYLP